MSILYKIRTIDDFCKLVNDISVHKHKGRISPHKYLLFIVAIKTIEKNGNKIYFDSYLINMFKELYREYDLDSKVVFPEYPFFHMRTSPWWKHKVKNGKQSKKKMKYQKQKKSIILRNN